MNIFKLICLWFLFLGCYACKKTNYPCPAYNEDQEKSSVKIGPDGTPINTVSVRYTENGLVKKKKVKKIHK